MPEITITVTGIDDVVKRLGSNWAEKAMRLPMEHSLMSIVDYMEEYPGPPQRPYPNMLRTAKQRRYFFWALKQGIIKVPYERRGKLGQSWTWRISSLGNGLHGVAGTDKSYAKYVQSSAHQALIHRGNWRTEMDAIRELRSDIIARFRRDIAAYVQRMSATS